MNIAGASVTTGPKQFKARLHHLRLKIICSAASWAADWLPVTQANEKVSWVVSVIMLQQNPPILSTLAEILIKKKKKKGITMCTLNIFPQLVLFYPQPPSTEPRDQSNGIKRTGSERCVCLHHYPTTIPVKSPQESRAVCSKGQCIACPWHHQIIQWHFRVSQVKTLIFETSLFLQPLHPTSPWAVLYLVSNNKGKSGLWSFQSNASLEQRLGIWVKTEMKRCWPLIKFHHRAFRLRNSKRSYMAFWMQQHGDSYWAGVSTTLLGHAVYLF